MGENMYLTDEEQGVLDGQHGEPQRLALNVLVKLGEACGAERMVEIASAHLVAAGLARSGKIPWLADYRDPWTTGSERRFASAARVSHHWLASPRGQPSASSWAGPTR